MNKFTHDLKIASRMLLKNPVFTLAAVGTLALGIGLNTAVFSAVYDLALKPLPGVHEPNDLVQVYRSWPGIQYGSNSIPHYFDLRDRSGHIFSGVAAWSLDAASVSSQGQSEMRLGKMVSANYFQVMGVTAEIGRLFIPEEEGRAPGASPVVVISHHFWQTRYAGDPEALGQSVIVNGHPYEIIGVLPSDFRGVIPILQADVWVPLMMQMEFMPGRNRFEARYNNFMQVIARLDPGVSPELAQEALDGLTLQLREEMPEAYREPEMLLIPQSEVVLAPEMRNAALGMSGVIMGVVGLLLLIACVNVANLFLARAQDRKKEIGVRLSLGASRLRVLSQLLTESALFSLVAGAAGLLLAYVAVEGASQITLPIDMPHSFDLSVNLPVLLFSLAVTVVAGIMFGLAPALQASRPDVVTALKGEISAEGVKGSRTSRFLVMGQMALSFVLLISAGLFLQNLAAATDIDKGFNPENVLVAAMDPSLQGYEEEETVQFYRDLLDRVRAYPGVTVAALGETVPLGFSSSDTSVEIPGYIPSPEERMSIRYNRVSPGYFEAMGIPMIQGREFTDQDNADGPGAIIVNQHFANRFWPGESPIGKQVSSAGMERTVVGLVPTGKYGSLGETPMAHQYFPLTQSFGAGAYLHVRTAGDPETLVQPLREIVRSLDPDLPIFDVKTMNTHLGIALMPARLAGIVLGAFGVLGLILASVGIYGVMAYSVAQRTREIGIRVAVGAGRSDVTGLVVRQGLRLVLVGGGLGLLGALGASQLIKSLLLTGRGIDPVSFVGVPLIMGAVALLATYLPARRAATVDPVRALKYE
jgi:predicted permease